MGGPLIYGFSFFFSKHQKAEEKKKNKRKQALRLVLQTRGPDLDIT